MYTHTTSQDRNSGYAVHTTAVAEILKGKRNVMAYMMPLLSPFCPGPRVQFILRSHITVVLL